jgi:hypothetical protein
MAIAGECVEAESGRTSIEPCLKKPDMRITEQNSHNGLRKTHPLCAVAMPAD